MHVEWSTAPLFVPLSLLGALAFLPFGVLIVASVVAFKQAASGASVVIGLVSLVGGLYFPVSLLPGWAQWMSEVQPFTPAADLIRHVVVGTSLADPAWLDIAKLAGFTVVVLPLSLLALRAALNMSRRRGSTVQY